MSVKGGNRRVHNHFREGRAGVVDPEVSGAVVITHFFYVGYCFGHGVLHGIVHINAGANDPSPFLEKSHIG